MSTVKNGMSTVKIYNQEDADQFLRKLGFRVGEDVVHRVVNAFRNDESLYELYASGNRWDGSARTPDCAKATVSKIKRLYKEGELDPYLSYIGFKPYIDTLGNLIENIEREKAISSVQADISDLLNDWSAELSLPLNYLDNENLSRGRVPHLIQGLVIKWEVGEHGEVMRSFLVEERDQFHEIERVIPPHLKLWGNFDDCKELGGDIIKACSQLAIDIRKQSETKTGFKIVSFVEGASKKMGLDRFFIWTIYADTLGLFFKEWEKCSYGYQDDGDGLYEIRWGTNRLAIVKPDVKDFVVDAHLKLREFFKESRKIKKILNLKRQLDVVENATRIELEIIQEYLRNMASSSTDTDTS